MFCLVKQKTLNDTTDADAVTGQLSDKLGALGARRIQRCLPGCQGVIGSPTPLPVFREGKRVEVLFMRNFRNMDVKCENGQRHPPPLPTIQEVIRLIISIFILVVELEEKQSMGV